jgi:hypothetical protein
MKKSVMFLVFVILTLFAPMKKSVMFLVFVILTLFAVDTVFAAAAKCPQKRKTKKAPSSLYKKDKTAKADPRPASTKRIKPPRPMLPRVKKSITRPPNPWRAKCAMVPKATEAGNWVRL